MKTNAHANDKQGRGGGLIGPFQPEEPRKHESEPMSWAWSKDPEMRRRWARVLSKKLESYLEQEEEKKSKENRKQVHMYGYF